MGRKNFAVKIYGVKIYSDVVEYLQKCLKETVDRTVEGLDQVDVLLRLCPEAPVESNKIISPLPASHMSLMALTTQQDQLWTNTQETVRV